MTNKTQIISFFIILSAIEQKTNQSVSFLINQVNHSTWNILINFSSNYNQYKQDQRPVG